MIAALYAEEITLAKKHLLLLLLLLLLLISAVGHLVRLKFEMTCLHVYKRFNEVTCL